MEATRQQIEDMAKKAIGQLSDEDIAYAIDKERGEYRGFAALHDLMDANMLIGDDVEVIDEEFCRIFNATVEEINRLLLCEHVLAPLDPQCIKCGVRILETDKNKYQHNALGGGEWISK